MKILSNYSPYEIDEIKEFISNSTPVQHTELKLEKGEEDCGWVNFYFRYKKEQFKVTLSLATSNLTEIVIFFENLIDLKEDIAMFLDDEIISEPLLYASPFDNNNIRLFIADGRAINKKWNSGDIDEEPALSQYEIRCDVIINKKKLLREFYRAVKIL